MRFRSVWARDLSAFGMGLRSSLPCLRVSPMVKTAHRKRGYRFPFAIEVELRVRQREPLPKGEDVSFCCGPLQGGNDRLWLSDILVPLLLEMDNPRQASRQTVCLPVDLVTLDASGLAIDQRLLGEHLHS